MKLSDEQKRQLGSTSSTPAKEKSSRLDCPTRAQDLHSGKWDIDYGPEAPEVWSIFVMASGCDEPHWNVTVEDYGTHYRVRGDGRYSKWTTVKKGA